MAHSVVVENLSKQYQIGELHRNTVLREALANIIRHPFRKKQKEAIWALKDVSFKIEEGEVFGIIGRNGAGKSTLLKVLAKITYPTSGTTKVKGRVASLLEVGTGFHEELTGRENIYLNGSILGMTKSKINAKMDEIVDFSGVEKFIDTPIKRYSSGMRLRLGFAVAAHLDAEILLIDEVLAVGDAEFQKKCLKTMDNLSGKGRTVLFVSHNMEAVGGLCQRVIWVDKGRLRKDGEPRKVIKDYLSAFTANQGETYDFSHIKDRGGNGDIRYTKIEFLDLNRQPKKLIRSGESLVARLHYHASKRVRNPDFAFELFTEYGTKVTSFNTWSSGFEIPFVPPGDGYVEVEIDHLNIFPSRYYISLWSASPGNLWYDRLDQCATLDIEPSDFCQSGNMPSRHFGVSVRKKMTASHFGIAFFPSSWQVRNL